jgi:hypothetical protein
MGNSTISVLHWLPLIWAVIHCMNSNELTLAWAYLVMYHWLNILSSTCMTV